MPRLRLRAPHETCVSDPPRGFRAALRGLDLALEEGLNVKVVLFPQGEDPDSFARSHSSSAVLQFLKANAKDFIVFKTNLLVEEKQEIEEGLKQAKNGELIPHKEVMAKYEKWRSKQSK